VLSPRQHDSSENVLIGCYEGRAMRHVIITGAFGLAFGLLVGAAAVVGPDIPKSLQEGGPGRSSNSARTTGRSALRAQHGRHVFALRPMSSEKWPMTVTSCACCQYIHAARRPTCSLLCLRGIDVAFTQSDVFE